MKCSTQPQNRGRPEANEGRVWFTLKRGTMKPYKAAIGGEGARNRAEEDGFKWMRVVRVVLQHPRAENGRTIVRFGSSTKKVKGGWS